MQHVTQQCAPLLCSLGALLLMLSFASCGGTSSDASAMGHHAVTLWNADTLNFVPGRVADSTLNATGDYRLDAGRIRLKPIALPRNDRRCDITLEGQLALGR